jgi:hypothetical protein
MARLSLFLLATLCVAIASSSEILEGNYYGYDDGEASGRSQSEAVTAQPAGTGNRRGNQQRGRHGQGQNRHHHHAANTTWTDEQKLAHICAHIVNPSDGHSSTRRNNRYHGTAMARKLQMLSPENRQTVTEMWNRRKQDMTRCCNEDSSDRKSECVNEVRLARYERVCNGEEPLCPWAAFMPARPGAESSAHLSTNTTTTTCCSRQGSERLECFATARAEYKRQYEQMKTRGHGHGHGHGQGHGHGHGHGRGSHEERRRPESDASRGEGRRNGGRRQQRPEGGN